MVRSVRFYACVGIEEEETESCLRQHSCFVVRLDLEMDYSESTKVVFQRIQKLDPENVSKIIGYLLLKDHGELEMIRLAFGPEYVIQSLIDKVKRDLNLSPKPAISGHVSAPQAKCSLVSNLPTKFTPFTPASSRSPWSSAALPADNCQWIPQVPTGQQLIHNFHYLPVAYLNSVAGGYGLQNQPQFLSLEDQLGSINLAGSYFHAQNYCPELARHPMPDQRSPSLPEFCPNFPELSMQICENFRHGYCKYGGSCRYLHVLQMENGYFMVLNPPKTDEVVNNDHVISHGSLKQLEMELIELLKTRRGIPVSISSLPLLYYDKYGRILQVDGYLTEAHRQGKVSCGLTQLLAQMTNCIRLIDRPHGRQSIILAEDILKYMRSIEERKEHESGVVASSCQIYLTFPPQSMFSEQDVYNYFNNFGPVQEVRIPSQDKRMFGFVTFVYPETSALVLTKTNPHFICGAQVLVKPYRLKPMLVDRKTEEKVQHPIYNDPYFPDAESNPPSSKTRTFSFELERKHILETEVTNSLSHNHTLLQFNCPEGFLSNCCTSEDKVNHIKTCNDNQESSEELNLPDSPFAYEFAHGISPII
ncbi:hypothetical protein Pfo_014398 [Paulownia fortunei]|nr:hypothetical protein Pfo_014398 [Paulownia fortunei]